MPGRRGGGSLSSSILYLELTFLLGSGLEFALLDGLLNAQGESEFSVSISLLATLKTYNIARR